MIEFTEFTEKLNSSELVSNAWDEIDRDQASAGLLIDTISNEFKDWQPPKELVVVPQIMADFIEENKKGFKLYDAFFEIAEGYGPGTKLYDWLFKKSNRQDLFARAWLDGYTVEKEKLYYLHEKNTGYYLTKKGDTLKLVVNPYFDETNEFAQEEIDKLNIGSYEQIEV